MSEDAGLLGPLAAELSARLEPGSVAVNAPLGARTTYRVGGCAAVMVEVATERELLAVGDAIEAAGAVETPVLVLGKGSNLLVADAGFCGLVVHPVGSLAGISVRPPGRGAAGAARTDGVTGQLRPAVEGDAGAVVVRAGGGAGLPVLARRTVEAGLTGLEWAVGIPGSVGGALAMNAGGHGADTAGCLVRYRWMDLGRGPAVSSDAAGEAGPDRLSLGYRSSALGPTEVVVWAELAARPGDVSAGRAAVADIVRWRRENQPGGSNAGSVFVNPAGDSAGRLVEACGLKGFRLGTARVSEKHANFIQADDRGAADDVARLIRYVQAVVAERSGVLLRPELKLVGYRDGGVPVP